MDGRKNISVSEIWLSEHERTIIIRLDDKTLISSDIYCNSWNYPIDYKISVNGKVHLVYHKINDLRQVDKHVEWVEVVGIIIDHENRKETINIRILVRGNLSDEYIKKLVENIRNSILAQCES